RPFRDKDYLKYVDDMLKRRWAGPLTMPGETCNGDPMTISRTGRCVSLQHRGVAFLKVVEIWRKSGGAAGPWGKYWPEEPVIEGIVVFGVSDAPQVIQTVDDSFSRDGADTIATSEIFQHDSKGSPYRPKDRAVLSKML